MGLFTKLTQTAIVTGTKIIIRETWRNPRVKRYVRRRVEKTAHDIIDRAVARAQETWKAGVEPVPCPRCGWDGRVTETRYGRSSVDHAPNIV